MLSSGGEPSAESWLASLALRQPEGPKCISETLHVRENNSTHARSAEPVTTRKMVLLGAWLQLSLLLSFSQASETLKASPAAQAKG